MNRTFDAVIIGCGASGLMCAISAKQKNRSLSVAVIERNDRVGKKLLSTGNGRCNLTNADIRPEKYAGSFKPQLSGIFAKYGTREMLSHFKELGLLVTLDKEGRYYPLCRHAGAVLDVLRFACERLGIEIFCSANINSLKKSGGVFTVCADDDRFLSRKLVIACGSKAAPKLGGTAAAADFLKNLGHSFLPFSPALCPLEVDCADLKALKGIRAAGNVSLISDGKTVKTERGEVQFTDKALSGICVFNLSLYAKVNDIIRLDLLPDYSEEEIYNILQKNKSLFTLQPCDCIFTGVMLKRIAQTALRSCGISSFSQPCSELTQAQLKALAKNVKALDFTVKRKTGFDQAQAALGGVLGGEIDGRTMKSLVCPGLYVCGEAVDVCGECGGYNLHFAFTSGIVAGENL